MTNPQHSETVKPDPLFDKLLSLMTVEELKDGIRQFSAQWNACQDLLASMTADRDALLEKLDEAKQHISVLDHSFAGVVEDRDALRAQLDAGTRGE